MGVLNYNPRTWVASAKLLAAQLNSEIRDPLTTLLGPWTAYAPTLSAETTAPNLGSGGSISGRYHQIGKTLLCQGQITIGSSGFSAGSGRWLIPLPGGLSFFDAKSIGHAYFNPAGPTTNFGVLGFINPASGLTSFYLFAPATTTASTMSGVGGGSGINNTPGGTALGAGGVIRWNFTAELG